MISREEKEYQKTRIRSILQDFWSKGQAKILLLAGKTEFFREAYLEMPPLAENTKLSFLKEYFSEIVCCFNQNESPDILLKDVSCLILDAIWEIKPNFDYHHSLLYLFEQMKRCKESTKFVLVYEGDLHNIMWMIERYIPDEAVLKIEVH